MKVLYGLLLLLCLSTVLSATTTISVEECGSNSVTVTLKTGDIKEKILTQNGVNYNLFGLDEYGYHAETGSPQLPFRTITLRTADNPDIAIEVLESDIEIRKDVMIYPAQEPLWAVTGKKQEISFTRDDKVYNKDSFFPNEPLYVQGTQTYRGTPITQIGISPLQFNPVSGELKIYRTLKVKITYSNTISPRGMNSSNNNAALLNNVISNFNDQARAIRAETDDNNDDILIITIPEFKAAAETLAVWHEMKGYDVKIDSKESWTSSEIKQTSHNFYNNTSPKPGYLILLGDHEHVPAQEINKQVGNTKLTFFTDNYYVCTGGQGDYMPEFSRGRISVEDANQAMGVIKKIIEYEKNPPTESSFYKNALGCAYFQDYDGGTNDGYADRAFAQVIERVNNYLADDQGITTHRIYNTPAYIKPNYWNNTYFSWGEAVPDHLKKPGFAWDGDVEDITKGINDGAFLVYHYDHGNHSGWGDPSFGIPHIDQYLTNGNKLPIIFSIDCLVGEFDKERYDLAAFYKVFKECFAEEILRKKDGGAAGIVAASTLSYSGWNDAFLQGMIDAIWPSDKMTLKSPHKSTVTATTHEPVYTMGDVLNQGLFRMTETWSLWDLAQLHYEMYHYFGDPTMAIWTKTPQTITVDNIEIAVNSSECQITGINAPNGIVTLYNLNKKNIIGKKAFKNSSATIALNNNGDAGDTVIVTITAHNFRPHIEQKVLESSTSIVKETFKSSHSLQIIGSRVMIHKGITQKGVVSVFDIKGRKLKSYIIDSDKLNYTFDMREENLANGTYIISLTVDNNTISKAIQLVR